MTTPGTYYHDFPRLAAQSGYFFRLYRGEVNWSEIENLSVEDVIERRNFQLLEKNLFNIVNIKLEEEFDLEILDQRFMKIFKIAQLGVDYLSYCLMYLDRCVILLQEQLIIYQKECEELKRMDQRKTEDPQKCKKKQELPNYRCEICHKVFISETYLKFHEKRRHTTKNISKCLNGVIKRAVDTYQQTDENGRVTTSTQTFLTDDIKIKQEEINDTDKNKQLNHVEVEHFKKELENLKIRMQKTENTQLEKKEIQNLPLCNFSAPVFYPFKDAFFPPNSMQQRDYYYPKNLGYLPPNSEHYQVILLSTSEARQIEPENKGNSTNNETNSCEKVKQKDSNPMSNSEEIDSSAATEEEACIKHDTKNQEKLIYNKENIRPKRSSKSTHINTTISLLPSNKEQNFGEIKSKDKHTENKSFCDTNLEKVVQSESITATIFSPTPSQNETKDEAQKQILKNPKESLTTKINEREISFNKIPTKKKILEVQSSPKSSSFNYSEISENSLKLHEFQKSTNFGDSVSSRIPSTLEKSNQKSSTFRIYSLENQLKELGVDPSWSGIPTNTMKLKLSILKHRRNLLTKDNPMYSIIRDSIRQKISNKLKNSQQKINLNEEDQNRKSYLENFSLVKTNKYIIDSDLESENSASEMKENIFYNQNILSQSVLKNEESDKKNTAN